MPNGAVLVAAEEGGKVAKKGISVVPALVLIVFSYYILKSWGMIGTSKSTSLASSSLTTLTSWKPLTQDQINNITFITS